MSHLHDASCRFSVSFNSRLLIRNNGPTNFIFTVVEEFNINNVTDFGDIMGVGCQITIPYYTSRSFFNLKKHKTYRLVHIKLTGI